MRASSELYAAARLTTFANLLVTQANWRTLWQEGGYLLGKLPPWTLPPIRLGKRKVDPASLRKNRAYMRLWKKDAAKPSGELWRAFVDDAIRLAAPKGKPVVPDLRLVGGWARKGRNGQRISEREFRALHRRTRDWLGTICGDQDIAPIIGMLRKRYRLTQRLCLVQGTAGGGTLTRHSVQFTLAPDVPQVTVEEQLDNLFVLTATGGLWPRFFQCEAEGCKRFGVMRVTGRGHHFCSDACRMSAHRHRKRPPRPLSPEVAKRREFRQRVEGLKANGMGNRDAHAKACKEFGYPPSGPPKGKRQARRHRG